MILNQPTFSLNPPFNSFLSPLFPKTKTPTALSSKDHKETFFCHSPLSHPGSYSPILYLFPSKHPKKPFLQNLSPPSYSNPSHEEDDHVIGDCIVLEEGIFEDPFAQQEFPEKPRKPKPVVVENLVPDDWKEAAKELNMSKRERRQIAQKMEFGSRLAKNKPRVIDMDQYSAYRSEKLSQLKPIVLDKPEGFHENSNDFSRIPDPINDRSDDNGELGLSSNHEGGAELCFSSNDEGGDELSFSSNGGGELGFSSSLRVVPRNPRLELEGGSFDDITEMFNGGYNGREESKEKSQGPRKLLTNEEKVLLNMRVPRLSDATSDKWLPVHTLAVSGQFYLLNALLKHNVDINATDKDGLTALHKSILCKKQAITNYLLRNSANPFVRDDDGATLMHYAVRVASVQTIKILLLYNVDINLSDDYGWTPLHLAVQTRRTDLVKLLLIKGADAKSKNKDGLTPLDICLYSGRDMRTYELLKLLKQLPRSH
ncbi:ankyrin repeat domain-containing protein, chloroplastic isoform X1 [Amborella trichopoda]|uniref:Uncharacterized protein n=1 Tax=Amborella trichopoda TaxID=13333 RepID=W1NKB6_AMBTC|nr:ankyrin repeat domain-containing protein, chloroplastic isoform X1 [Amborella trichopoda]ERM96237.1 hypothetical protein AMTR_s00001p00138080 [Amborella trichopoda]|eukprot:XP_006828821.1 ankyrin repeat domain-containing protein, chloroplastic isoform X1 [Amborella trichopoda]